MISHSKGNFWMCSGQNLGGILLGPDGRSLINSFFKTKIKRNLLIGMNKKNFYLYGQEHFLALQCHTKKFETI